MFKCDGAAEDWEQTARGVPHHRPFPMTFNVTPERKGPNLRLNAERQSMQMSN